MRTTKRKRYEDIPRTENLGMADQRMCCAPPAFRFLYCNTTSMYSIIRVVVVVERVCFWAICLLAKGWGWA